MEQQTMWLLNELHMVSYHKTHSHTMLQMKDKNKSHLHLTCTHGWSFLSCSVCWLIYVIFCSKSWNAMLKELLYSTKEQEWERTGEKENKIIIPPPSIPFKTEPLFCKEVSITEIWWDELPCIWTNLPKNITRN